MYGDFCWKGSLFRLIVNEPTKKTLYDGMDEKPYIILKEKPLKCSLEGDFLLFVFILEGKEGEVLDGIDCQMVYNCL